jgi:hypothetical protein
VAQELARLTALDGELARLQHELHTCETLAVPVTSTACAQPAAAPKSTTVDLAA